MTITQTFKAYAKCALLTAVPTAFAAAVGGENAAFITAASVAGTYGAIWALKDEGVIPQTFLPSLVPSTAAKPLEQTRTPQ